MQDAKSRARSNPCSARNAKWSAWSNPDDREAVSVESGVIRRKHKRQVSAAERSAAGANAARQVRRYPRLTTAASVERGDIRGQRGTESAERGVIRAKRGTPSVEHEAIRERCER